MNYQQTVEYLFNSTPVFERVGAVAYKEGLDNTHALDAHFNHPHRNYLTIHVAGTNGKGSCSHTLAAILQAAGYRVGLYTSPHIVDFRERIRVNGQCIPEQRVVDFVAHERSFFEPLHPSFFELTTALAFLYFAEQHFDVAVVEVGLGGRLDCTNIITPELSIITNISMDHTQFLGNTLAKIAGEKAGIIKPGVPVVVGEYVAETRPVFQHKAHEMHAPITYAQDHELVAGATPSADGGLDYTLADGTTLHGELGGWYQQRNTNTVLTALRVLSNNPHFSNITPGSICEGFAHVCGLTHLVGRWQTLQQQPHVVCDTGHNVGGWQWLSRQLAGQQCRKLRIVFGMVNDKDISTVMSMLPATAAYYFTQPSCSRAQPVEQVAQTAARYHLQGRSYPTVMQAYHAALADADPADFVFVGGSSYVVADLLAGN